MLIVNSAAQVGNQAGSAAVTGLAVQSAKTAREASPVASSRMRVVVRMREMGCEMEVLIRRSIWRRQYGPLSGSTRLDRRGMSTAPLASQHPASVQELIRILESYDRFERELTTSTDIDDSRRRARIKCRIRTGMVRKECREDSLHRIEVFRIKSMSLCSEDAEKGIEPNTENAVWKR